jgi:hypothetical protein
MRSASCLDAPTLLLFAARPGRIVLHVLTSKNPQPPYMAKMAGKHPETPDVLVVPVAKSAQKAGNSPHMVVFSTP